MNIAELLQQPANFAFQGLSVTVTQAFDEKSGMGKNGKQWSLRSMMIADDFGGTAKITWWSPTIHDVSLIAGNKFYIQKGKVHHNQYNGQVQVELQCSGNEMVHQSAGGMQAPTQVQGLPVQAPGAPGMLSMNSDVCPPASFVPPPTAALLTPQSTTKLTDLQMLEKMRQYSTILREFLPEGEVQSAIATLIISCQKGQCTMTPLVDPNDLSEVIHF